MKSKWLAYIIPAGIVVFDILTKIWVKSAFKIQGTSKEILGSFLKFTYLENAGIAFGIFSDISHTSVAKNLIFLLVTLAAVGFIVYLIKVTKEFFPRLSLYFILGGALGNIVERTFGHIFYFGKFKLFYGRVVDFIDVGFGASRWPSFNVADSFITVGVVLLIVYTLFFEKKEVKS